MSLSRYLTALLCALAIGSAHAEESAQGDSSVVDKTTHAVHKGAKATESGAGYVAEKVVNGIKRGANATGRFIERGGHATGRALGTATDKVGLGNKGKTANEPPPSGND